MGHWICKMFGHGYCCDHPFAVCRWCRRDRQGIENMLRPAPFDQEFD